MRPADHDYTGVINNNNFSNTDVNAKPMTASRKRKSRDPDYFKMINGDSDPEDIDEFIFKSAKIEYTNVDGTKVTLIIYKFLTEFFVYFYSHWMIFRVQNVRHSLSLELA